ncbi:MAG: SCO family protein [Myxococcaceae bacterium]|nr:SCO family protein [Myxococcaceae bacterium]MCI0672195.1 SCO family protein [Myxococcaceae bacterium]
MHRRISDIRPLFVAALLVATAASALPGGASAPRELTEEATRPPALRGVDVEEHLGEQVPLDLALTDEEGRAVTLGQLLPGNTPVVLTLVYYRCPMLCNLVLNGLVRSMRDVGMTLGEGYRAVTVSIDPLDTPLKSQQRRRHHLQALGMPERAPWSFLTGPDEQVKRLADAVGFRYTYDASTQQYAHPAVAMVLTPEGKVSRYLYGADFPQRDLRLALIEAGQGKVGTSFERVILSCFKYDPATKRYGFYIFGFLRLGALVVFGALATLLGVSWWREFKKGSVA